jgi:aspartyl/asparaginyl beta-hydroxylase (cupin superfamily)
MLDKLTGHKSAVRACRRLEGGCEGLNAFARSRVLAGSQSRCVFKGEVRGQAKVSLKDIFERWVGRAGTEFDLGLLYALKILGSVLPWCHCKDEGLS